MDELIIKTVQNLGTTGLVCFLGYRLIDRYTGQFFEHIKRFIGVNAQQAQAITDVATTVKASHDDQRDIVMAIRVLTGKVDDVIGWQKEIDEKFKKGQIAR